MEKFTKRGKWNLAGFERTETFLFHVCHTVKRIKHFSIDACVIDFQSVPETTIFDNISNEGENFRNAADPCNFRFCRDFCLRHGTMTRRKLHISILLGFIPEFPVTWCTVFPRFYHPRVDFVFDFEIKEKKRTKTRKDIARNNNNNSLFKKYACFVFWFLS